MFPPWQWTERGQELIVDMARLRTDRAGKCSGRDLCLDAPAVEEESWPGIDYGFDWGHGLPVTPFGGLE